MKKILLCLGALLAVYQIEAQTISDCEGAIPLCNTFYSESLAPTGTGNVYEFTGTCNQNLETSSVWYTFTVQQDGLLSFVLTPNNLNDDYDWGLFDITEGGCQGLGTTSPEVSCNSWGTLTPPNGPTGISTLLGGLTNSGGPGNLNGPPFNADLPVQAGHTFALVVMNWSNSVDGYSLDFGQSTASLYDNISPQVDSSYTVCREDSLYLYFSEPVLISSIANTDFHIIAPDGGISTATGFTTGSAQYATHEVGIAFNGASGAYTLVLGNDTTAIVDPCGNRAIDTVRFLLSGNFSVDFTVSNACNGENGALTLNAFNNGISPIRVYFQNNLIPVQTIGSLIPGDYSLTVTDSLQCTIEVPFSVGNNDLDVVVEPVDTLSCSKTSVQVDSLVVIPAQEVSYLWSTTDNGAQILSDPTLQYPVLGGAGIYQLVVTSLLTGCTAGTSIYVERENSLDIRLSDIVIPNVVTPDGNGNNDGWLPYIPGLDVNVLSLLDVYDLSVYNRWGQLVYSSDNKKAPWYATDVNEGLYFYTLKMSTNCGAVQTRELSGSIEVLRKGK